MTEFSALIEPNQLTTDLALIIFMFFIMFAYLGFRLRNGLILFSWMLSIIVFILTFMIELPFIWFWIMIMITSIIISFIGVWNYIIEPYKNQ